MRTIKTVQGAAILVDDEDYMMLSQWKWSAHLTNGGLYAKRFQVIDGRQRIIAMHRQLMGLKHGDKLVVDHIDDNGLNNQKNNLRVTTNSLNIARQKKKIGRYASPFKGVTRDKRRLNHKKPWIAQGHIRIGDRRKSIYLGAFYTEEEAAYAYDKFALSKYGKIARLNFPHES